MKTPANSRKSKTEDDIAALHLSCLHWISDLEFWGNESQFFQKLLVAKGKEIRSERGLTKYNRLQRKLKVFAEGLLPEYKRRATQYENKLSLLYDVIGKENFQYKKLHKDYSHEINALEKSMYSFRKEVLGFARQ